MSKESIYTPSGSGSSSSDEETFEPSRKNGRKVTRKRPNSSGQPDQKKQKRNALKRRNHDDFFENIEKQTTSKSRSALQQIAIDVNSSISEDSNISGKSQQSTVEISHDSLHSMVSRKLEAISNQLNQHANDMVELKHELVGVKRLVAKVEVLIKCRKESNSSDSDQHFLNTLQSYRLPITTIENLDNLEQRLGNENEKTKLVSLLNSFEQKCLFFILFHIQISCLISVACFN